MNKVDSLDKNTATQEEEIDLIELIEKLWNRRKLILKVCGIALIIALVVAFSIPKTYTTTVKLAPELGSAKGGSMGQLAALAGINLQPQGMQDLSPDVYPDIMQSTPFLMGLFDVQVKDSKMRIDTTLFIYFAKYQKKAWWSYITNAPFKLIGLFSSKKVEKSRGKTEDSGNLQPLVISRQQSGIMGALKNSINVSVDKKTQVITLSSTMQSPEISALIADTITSYMQNYIIGYRTKKARKDLDFSEYLYQDAKDKYYQAQQAYASYSDENTGIISARYRTTQERLQNEMNLAYGIYNQTAQQLQYAKVKVQDTTPVYTVVEPSVVPLKESGPSWKLIIIGFVFLGFIGASGWILLKEFMLPLLNKEKL